MFGLGASEIALIFVVALVVFGPDKLPEIAKTLGKTIGDLKRAMDEVKRDISIGDLQRDIGISKREIKNELFGLDAHKELAKDSPLESIASPTTPATVSTAKSLDKLPEINSTEEISTGKESDGEKSS